MAVGIPNSKLEKYNNNSLVEKECDAGPGLRIPPKRLRTYYSHFDRGKLELSGVAGPRNHRYLQPGLFVEAGFLVLG